MSTAVESELGATWLSVLRLTLLESKYDRLIARAKGVAAAQTLVVYPCDETSLRGATRCSRGWHYHADPGRPCGDCQRPCPRAQARYRANSN